MTPCHDERVRGRSVERVAGGDRGANCSVGVAVKMIVAAARVVIAVRNR